MRGSRIDGSRRRAGWADDRRSCDIVDLRRRVFVHLSTTLMHSRKDGSMRFLLLVDWDREAMDAREEPAAGEPEEDEGFPWLDDLQARGKWVIGDGSRRRAALARCACAMTGRRVTDGPFVETKEAVGGSTSSRPRTWTRRSRSRRATRSPPSRSSVTATRCALMIRRAGSPRARGAPGVAPRSPPGPPSRGAAPGPGGSASTRSNSGWCVGQRGRARSISWRPAS